MIEYIVKVYDNYTEWYLNDQRHREDGPAIEYSDGSKHWWLNGKGYTESDYKKEILKRNPIEPEPLPEYVVNDIHDCLIFEEL